MKLISLSVIHMEWNVYNGPFFRILEIETESFDRSMLSFWTDGKKVEIGFLFLNFKFYYPLR